MSTGYEPYEEPEELLDRRRSAVIRTIALVVLLAFGATYAGLNLASFARNREIAPLDGVADPRGFKFLNLDPSSQLPVRYNPCTPVHYVINPVNAPQGGVNDVHGAVALTAEATGISFVFDGIVDEPLSAADREPVQEARYGHRWAPILIGWIPFDATVFKVDDVGVAGSLIERNRDGRLVLVTGSILMNGADQLDNGFRPGKTWGKVVLHEFGHVLGLGHVADPAQVMNPSLVSSPAAWGTGDRAGLTLLGRGAGCLDPPPVP